MNKDTIIGNNIISGNPTIYCYKGSTAETWALDQELNVVLLDDEDFSNYPIVSLPTNLRIPIGMDTQAPAEIFYIQPISQQNWTSSDESIVRVNQSGILTAVHSGTAQITLTVDGKSASTAVTVGPVISSISLPEVIYSIVSGSSNNPIIVEPVDAVYDLEYDFDYQYASVHTTIYSSNSNQLLTVNGRAAGSTTITITDKISGFKKTIPLKIGRTISSAAFEQEAFTIHTGQTIQPVINFQMGQYQVTNQLIGYWAITSGDRNAITLDQYTGEVTGVSPGTVAITAADSNFHVINSTCTITVIDDSSPIATIDESTFPDPVFRSLVNGYDKNSDGKLSENEIAQVKSLSCSSKGITSLKGIELFTELTSITCNNNSLTSLDVSNLTKLTYLDCDSNSLSSLNISGCQALKSIYCSKNNLTELTFNCPFLETLYCHSNQLTSLDCSGCSVLKTLSCDANRLTALNLDCPQLQKLNCYNNKLTTLDVTGSPSLKYIDCNTNSITALDVSNCTLLEHLCFNINNVTIMDASNCPALKELYGYKNQLTTLNINNCSSLEDLSCWSNNLSSLDMSQCPNLKIVRCYTNHISTLDLSYNPLLEYLHCESNNLSALNIGSNPLLNSLGCEGNSFSTLDVSSSSALCNFVKKNERLTYNGKYDYLSDRFTFSFDRNVTIIAGELISEPFDNTPGDDKPILTVSTDASSYDYGQVVILTASITNPDGTTSGLEEAYPNAQINATLLTSSGSVVSDFIIQGMEGLYLECEFPMSSDNMKAGDYKILVETNVSHLSTETPVFHYTADKSNIPNPSGCNVSLSLNSTVFTLNERIKMTATVKDQDGNAANGIKVVYQIFDMQYNNTNMLGGKYTGIYDLTYGDGTCTVSIARGEKPDRYIHPGKYIVRATIYETGVYDEQTFDFKMNEMHLPSSLQTIESEAFSNLSSQAVYIPSGCTSIGEYAFRGCHNLLYVWIPSSVESYPANAFDDCNENLIIEWENH